MPDYQQMYKTLFQAITRTIDILQKAQQETEEMYISADETVLTLLENIADVGNEKRDLGDASSIENK